MGGYVGIGVFKDISIYIYMYIHEYEGYVRVCRDVLQVNIYLRL